MNHCHEETDKENDATLALPYEDLVLLRLIAVANDASPAEMVRYWSREYLDSRKDSLKDGNFRN